jgi:rod shape-determining protein MreC
MSKKYFFLFFIIVISLSYYFHIDRLIINRYNTLLDKIKYYYVSKLSDIDIVITRYFSQAKNIQELQKQIKELQPYKTLYIKNNKEDINTTITNKNLIKTTVLSYKSFYDMTNVLLKVKDNNLSKNKIYGLIYENNAVGIARYKDGELIGLLNGNQKSNYAVYIGKNKAPGITHNIKKSNFIKIKFIPIWIEINIGDEVVTSGMDKIFFNGLKVGKVVDIQKHDTTQEAIVQPYIEVLNKRNFYLYKDIIPN